MEKKVELVSTAKPKWILPPGLKQHFHKFVALYNTVFKNPSAKRRPIIIYGDTGVGKSMFTHVFENLYLRDQKSVTNEKVKRVNICAFPETIFESQIFGHMKGAFTGAVKETKGFIETANLLILEEIGELSKESQAKLLTFIEDGIYYKLGSTEPGHIEEDVQIIATTNVDIKSAKFRQDFLGRCYTFHVPALHERRGDLLYVLFYKHPELFRTLAPWQILAIMAYDWPGNMRELEKFGETESTEFCSQDFFHPDLFEAVNRRIFDIGLPHDRLEREFLKNGISTKQDLYMRPAFKFKRNDAPATKPVDGYDSIKAIEAFNPFERATKAMAFFAQLFCVRFDAGISLMDPPTITGKYPEFFSSPSFVSTYPEILNLPGAAVILYKSDDYARNLRLNQSKDVMQISDFSAMTEKDLLKFYYTKQLFLAEGNVAEVARRSGVNRKTLDDKLKRLGIKPKKLQEK